MNRIKILLACIFLTLPILSSACKIVGLEREIQFPPGVAELPASELRPIVDWYIYNRDVHGITEIGIYAYAAKVGQPTEQLAYKRVKQLSNLMQTLSSTPMPTLAVDITKIDSNTTLMPINQVAISMQPMCLKTGTCCPMPIK